jgi:hypothetical protein
MNPNVPFLFVARAGELDPTAPVDVDSAMADLGRSSFPKSLRYRVVKHEEMTAGVQWLLDVMYGRDVPSKEIATELKKSEAGLGWLKRMPSLFKPHAMGSTHGSVVALSA